MLAPEGSLACSTSALAPDFAKTKLFGMNATNKVFLPDDQREA